MLTTVSKTGIRSETDRCMTNGNARKEKDAHRQGHLEYPFWLFILSKRNRHEQMHNCYIKQMHKCPRRSLIISLLVNKDPNKDHEQAHQKANQFPLDTILKNEEQ